MILAKLCFSWLSFLHFATFCKTFGGILLSDVISEQRVLALDTPLPPPKIADMLNHNSYAKSYYQQKCNLKNANACWFHTADRGQAEKRVFRVFHVARR